LVVADATNLDELFTLRKGFIGFFMPKTLSPSLVELAEGPDQFAGGVHANFARCDNSEDASVSSEPTVICVLVRDNECPLRVRTYLSGGSGGGAALP